MRITLIPVLGKMFILICTTFQSSANNVEKYVVPQQTHSKTSTTSFVIGRDLKEVINFV